MVKQLLAVVLISAISIPNAHALLEDDEETFDGGGIGSDGFDGGYGGFDAGWSDASYEGNGRDIVPPQPAECMDAQWDEGRQAWVVTVEGTKAANPDGTGATVPTPPTTVTIVADQDQPVRLYPVTPDFPNPTTNGRAPYFLGTDPDLHTDPGSVVIVTTTAPNGTPLDMAVTPVVPIIFTMNAAQNHVIIVQKINELSKIANLQLRHAALGRLITMFLAAEQVGYPFATSTWNTLQSTWRAVGALLRMGAVTGAVSGAASAATLGFLGTATAIGGSWLAGYWLGSQIYNKWSWLNEGALDPLFCWIHTRILRDQQTCW